MNNKIDNFYNLIKEQEIEFINFKFTNNQAQWLNLSYLIKQLEPQMLINGIRINKSQQIALKIKGNILIPDITSYFVDPFAAQPTMIMIAEIINSTAISDDPRLTLKKAIDYLKSTQIAEQSIGKAKVEFYLFDQVKTKLKSNEITLKMDLPISENNIANRESCLSLAPVDSFIDIKAEMLTMLQTVGINSTSHYSYSSNQACLEFTEDNLINLADNIQKYKYVIKSVAHSYGKTATFIPKPLNQERGSTMIIELWLIAKELLVFGEKNQITELAHYYIGGIIKHYSAISAFVNPTTNSYRRLLDEFDSISFFDYQNNQSTSSLKLINDELTKFELYSCDPTANPYYALAAILLAGLDGIKNKIKPEAASIDINISKFNKLPTTNLRESLIALWQDKEFLTKDGVFNKQQINSYIEEKLSQLRTIEATPHPIEFNYYYNN